MPYRLKQLLEALACEKAPGPSAAFSVFHISRAIELNAKKPIGRNLLAHNLNTGEGVARTIISRLRDAGLITVSKAGCVLTKKGLSVMNNYQQTIKKVEFGKSELTNNEWNWAILVKNQGYKLKSGMEQRDAAVKNGAADATTMVFKKRHLVIPSISNDAMRDFPQAAKQIMRSFKLEENDVVIIAGASDSGIAERGALAAAWTLLDDN